MNNKFALRALLPGALLLSLLAGCDTKKTEAPTTTESPAATSTAEKVTWPAIASAVKKDLNLFAITASKAIEKFASNRSLIIGFFTAPPFLL